MASVTYLKEFASTGSFYMSTYVRSSFMAKMLSLFNIACNYRTMHSYINAFHLPREIYLTQYSNPWLYWSMVTMFLNSKLRHRVFHKIVPNQAWYHEKEMCIRIEHIVQGSIYEIGYNFLFLLSCLNYIFKYIGL